MADPVFVWSERAQRYRNERGQFVAETRIREHIDTIADTASERMRAVSRKLLTGQTTLAEWELEMRTHLRVAHVATTTIALGGVNNLSPSTWGRIGASVIKPEYAYLRNFADGIESGDVPLDGRIVSRAAQYGQASRDSFEAERTRSARARGVKRVRNILHATNSCSECSSLAGQGWMPIDDMPPVGSRKCKSNCRCTLEFHRAALAA